MIMKVFDLHLQQLASLSELDNVEIDTEIFLITAGEMKGHAKLPVILNLKVNRWCCSLYYIKLKILDLNNVEIDTEIFLMAWIQTEICNERSREIARDLEFES